MGNSYKGLITPSNQLSVQGGQVGHTISTHREFQNSLEVEFGRPSWPPWPLERKDPIIRAF
jgi:hypothetical protein